MNIFCLIGLALTAEIKFGTEPVWESVDSDYSTGGILADIDKDSDLDLVIGNGNDMARNHNKVYYNIGDSLERTASWSSDETACNGHVSLGDMDSDGFLDLAVAGFAKSEPWVDQDLSRVYRNINGSFTSSPIWTGGDTLRNFSCDFGDADGDGDLDLALASGNDYEYKKQKVVVYKNNDGELSSTTMWQSEDADFNMDVCWVDVDADGDLDIAAGGYGRNRIYFMEDGKLNAKAGWVSADLHNTVQIAFGDFDSDGYLDMATADNNQTGEDASRIRIYRNNKGTMDTLPFWESRLWIYQSCVAWADADGDGDLDLASGGWWEPLCIYENKSGSFDTMPAWTWSPLNPYSLVCEQVVWGEVNNDNWREETESLGNVTAGKVIYPTRFPILDLLEVKINGAASPPSDYKWNPADGWIQINKSGNVEIKYRYTRFPDLLVTNWVGSTGNFLFYNLNKDTTTGINVERIDNPQTLNLALSKTVLQRGDHFSLVSTTHQKIERFSLFDITGRKITSIEINKEITSSLEIPYDTRNLSRGVYLIEFTTPTGKGVLRFIIP